MISVAADKKFPLKEFENVIFPSYLFFIFKNKTNLHPDNSQVNKRLNKIYSAFVYAVEYCVSYCVTKCKGSITNVLGLWGVLSFDSVGFGETKWQE